ncbi:ribonuclease E/G [Mesorhizobium sp. CAU 1741]|uniref:Rne/Rng family ribonuclease n=1 Tax=Mesorhizobium sp. CAU 1741 TaxID=3140366 RepID=UPI00325A69B4
MPNKMLIDASHPEETRVVVVRGNRIEEFDFESQDKKQLKGNIYLARVTRVEPSLQAAFVEYGGNRHGFLAFSEIHPDYYQIPVADRQALLRAEAEEARAEDDDEDGDERGGRNKRRRRGGGRNRSRSDDERKASSENGGTDDDAESDGGDNDESPRTIAESIDAEVVTEEIASDDEGSDRKPADDQGDDDNGDDARGGGNGDDEVVSVGADDALEEVHERRRTPRRHYKIQEVIKRRQILLVQVVKEERGNKGAALTTYLSLAGRYSVLMPNTARGGGISRKITNAADRKRLKDVVKDLDVPQGMGVILRTAGESRTKAEIKRDYEYLMRMWDNVRTLTLQSAAPALVYEEGSLIKRSVRDLYNKDIDEILVAGEDGYREAKDFMRMLMPSHAKVVQPYRDPVPIFARSGIEGQLDKMLQPQVTLKSGGYIIINQTEALVAIDVNSGRSTKEHSIEDTALQTNLEAAEEVARQLRLRDLAGLIVIDFIDMEENRNNRSVEKRLKDCLKNDRARIQVGRISHFGLLEMSRQRIRASVLDSTMQPCPHCGGTGHVRSESSVALLVVRAIEEFLLKDSRNDISVRTPTSTAIYVLNHKRSTLIELENRFGLEISIEADDSVRSQHYAIFKGAISERPVVAAPVLTTPIYDDADDDIVDDAAIEEEAETEVVAQPRSDEDGDGQRKRKRRRRRRGGRDRDRNQPQAADGEDDSVSADAQADDDAGDGDGAAETSAEDGDEDGSPKKRRRGKRGGRRNRRDEGAEGESQADAGGDDGAAVEPSFEPVEPAVLEQADQAAMDAVEKTGEPLAAVAEVEKPKKKAPRRSTKKPKASEEEVAEAAADLAAEPVVEDTAKAPEEEPAKAKPKRAPRRKVAASATADATVEEPVSPAEVEAETPAPEAEPEAPAAQPIPIRDSKPAEPVLTSTGAKGEEDAKPRKAGWWQRKGFF